MHHNSKVQIKVEDLIRKRLGAQFCRLGKLRPETLKFKDAKVCVDVLVENAEKKGVLLAEIYARIGALKAAQKNKVLSDVLKMSFIAAEKAKDWDGYSVQKRMVFVDECAAAYLKGKSWPALVAKKLNVKPVVVRLPQKVLDQIRKAQAKQNLISKRNANDSLLSKRIAAP